MSSLSIPSFKKSILLSAAVFAQIILLVLLGACGKNKKSSSEPAALASINSAADAIPSVGAESTTIESCLKDDEEKEEEVEVEEEEEAENDDEVALKAKDKGNKGKKSQECTTTTTPASAPASSSTGAASLAEGQKIYAANCQSCHGALPGQKQGRSADAILAASTVGPHKSITPWPAGQASALSAQLAAESLAMAMQ